MVPVIPPELCVSIAHHLYQKSDLGTCSLVCRAWLPAFRSSLFKFMALEYGDIRDTESETLCLIYAENSTIPSYVRDLWLQLDNGSYPDLKSRYHEELPKLLPLFRKLQSLDLRYIIWEDLTHDVQNTLFAAVANLTSLKLYSVTFEAPDQFLQLLSSASCLEYFAISYSTVGNGQTPTYPSADVDRQLLVPSRNMTLEPSQGSSPLVQSPSPSHISPPHRLKKIFFESSDCSSPLIQWLQLYPAPAHKLDISINYNNGDFRELPLMITYLLRLGAALEHLSITLPPRQDRSTYTSVQYI